MNILKKGGCDITKGDPKYAGFFPPTAYDSFVSRFGLFAVKGWKFSIHWEWMGINEEPKILISMDKGVPLMPVEVRPEPKRGLQSFIK